MTPERLKDIERRIVGCGSLGHELLAEVKRLRTQSADDIAADPVYFVGAEPLQWREGTVVLGWRAGPNRWYPVDWWISLDAWAPDDDEEGPRPTHVRRMPPVPNHQHLSAPPPLQWCAGRPRRHASGGLLMRAAGSDVHTCKRCGCMYSVTP